MLRSGTFQIPAESIDDTHVHSSVMMIIEAATLAGSGHATVLGSGKCTEIPIRHLSSLLPQIDLVDLDGCAIESIEKQSHQWEEIRGHCTFYQADLTGLIPQIESRARDIVMRASEPLSCLHKLGELLISTPPNFWIPPKDEKYSLIICSGILTQLQAVVRKTLENIFLDRFPEHISLLSSHGQWRRFAWNFARNLEDAFIDHLESLSTPDGIIYLSDTVHVCLLLQLTPRTFVTEGTWIATRTAQLTDYLRPWNKVVAERQWMWVSRRQEGLYWGRLYGVQAVIYRRGGLEPSSF